MGLRRAAGLAAPGDTGVLKGVGPSAEATLLGLPEAPGDVHGKWRRCRVALGGQRGRWLAGRAWRLQSGPSGKADRPPPLWLSSLGIMFWLLSILTSVWLMGSVPWFALIGPGICPVPA